MCRYHVLIGLLLVSHALLPQTFERKPGSISQEELTMQRYEADTLAEALVLFDIGHSTFRLGREGQWIHFTRSRRMKVLHEAGSDFGEIQIALYQDDTEREQLVSFEGMSYLLENGQLTKKSITLQDGLTDKVTDRIRLVKFVFPHVKAGAVIEYTYEIETPFLFNLPDWDFQDRVPTLYSSYRVDLTPYYEYVYLLRGETSKLKYASQNGYHNSFMGSEYREMHHTFVMTNVPALREEAFTISRQHHLTSIDFQLAQITGPDGAKKQIIPTWPGMVKAFYDEERFGGFLKKAKKPAQGLLAELNRQEAWTESETAQAIIDHVKQSFRVDRIQMLAQHTPSEMLKLRTGNSADLNLMAIAMLQAAGLSAQPLILSTRSHGPVFPDHPIAALFNYTAIYLEIDGQPAVCDATDPHLPFNRIPPWCRNGSGLVMTKDNPFWVELQSGRGSEVNVICQFNPDPVTQSAHVTVSVRADDLEGYYMRAQLKDDSTLIANRFREIGLSSVESQKSTGFEQTAQPYLTAVRGQIDLEAIAEFLVVKPFLSLPEYQYP